MDLYAVILYNEQDFVIKFGGDFRNNEVSVSNMHTIPLSEITLEDLLPHRGDMMLIGEVLEVDRQHALTISHVDRFWPMADDKGVLSLVLVELAAQTAGVCNGWDRIQSKGLDSDKMGWLVGIKKADFLIDYLPIGGKILSLSENLYNFGNLREISCRQHMENTLIGSMTLQLFQA
jgi:predicted hotdog family 3-hydroxylacyl-ACP dehydratase